MLKVRRVLVILCLFVFLGLPLAAQTERESASPSPAVRFLELVWERLSAPLAPITAIWQADEGADEGSGAEIPDPGPLPGAGGLWDPFG